eukprot:NODE_411_length_7931_cov_0.531920.p1 type:complete len:619 gc:universal NODE_411_length_7931_cov_0.531920:5191-7047(+)
MFKLDSLVATLFLVMAIATRFFHIHVPPEVVFDEVHFGKFASYYIRRTYYFDVHPPLGRLLLALVSWSFGYKGHFNFSKIGESYTENNVPYLVFRGWTAFCGSLLVIFVYKMMRKMGYTVGAVIATVAVVFDNSLITQSRFILLDSMLMLFMTFCIYSWISFYKERYRPFSFNWWKWLIFTGVGLGCVMGVKMVGLFTVMTIGIATVKDLWDLLDSSRKLTMNQWMNHLYARMFALIVVPLFLYLVWFQIHFMVLTKTGPGDNFMSPRFQTTLQGSKMSGEAETVYYGATLHLKALNQNCYLHSHKHNYPLKYEDGRISSQGQQVTCYAHSDINNAFLILPTSENPQDWTKYESSEVAAKAIKDKEYVMFKHINTGCYLLSHDVASPLTPTNTEFTCSKDPSKFKNMVFKMQLERADTLKTLGVTFKVIHNDTNVAMYANRKKLPEWGFNQQEINGNKKVPEKDNLWMIESAINLNFTTKPVEEHTTLDKPGFLEKFVELQQRMVSSNSRLTKSHPYQSEPWEWFFLHRGVSFWQSKSDKQQVYLIGNVFTWWFASSSIFIYVFVVLLHLLSQKRQFRFFNSCTLILFRYWTSLGVFHEFLINGLFISLYSVLVNGQK